MVGEFLRADVESIELINHRRLFKSILTEIRRGCRRYGVRAGILRTPQVCFIIVDQIVVRRFSILSEVVFDEAVASVREVNPMIYNIVPMDART